MENQTKYALIRCRKEAKIKMHWSTLERGKKVHWEKFPEKNFDFISDNEEALTYQHE